jgi:methionyl-tRNA synthetase
MKERRRGYWKIKTRSWFTLGKDNIVFIASFPTMLKAEGSYILPEQCACKRVLNLEGNKLSTTKTGQFGYVDI